MWTVKNADKLNQCGGNVNSKRLKLNLCLLHENYASRKPALKEPRDRLTPKYQLYVGLAGSKSTTLFCKSRWASLLFLEVGQSEQRFFLLQGLAPFVFSFGPLAHLFPSEFNLNSSFLVTSLHFTKLTPALRLHRRSFSSLNFGVFS